MPIYLPNEYADIAKELEPFIEENQLDQVTVSSLVQGCVKFSDIEDPQASIAVLQKDDLDKSYSIKGRNIKIGLSYALDVIFAAKMIPTAEDIWLILAVLKTILTLLKGTVVTIGKEEAAVLFAIYRLREAEEGDIEEYMSHNMSEITSSNQSVVDLHQALANLERIHAIELVDGKYRLIETIIIA